MSSNIRKSYELLFDVAGKLWFCGIRSLTWKLVHKFASGESTVYYAVMYCLQWLIPVLLLPKPLNPPMLQTHAVFMVLYLTGFFLERKPCTICSIVFVAAAILLCYSGIGNCIFWSSGNCDSVSCEAAQS